MAGRKFTKQGKAKEKWTGASVGEEGLPSHQNQRDKRTGPQSQREGWVGTPGVGRRAGLDPRVRGRRGLNPRDRKPGSDPRGQGCRPASGLGPRGAGRGRIRAGSAAPSAVYLCPVPGAASFPILRSRSFLPLPPRRLRPRIPGHGSVAATPLCPGQSPRSPRLRSPLLPSLFSRGRRRLFFAQPWSE